MQNPEELIMLFENPSSNTHTFSDRQVCPHTHKHTHTHTDKERQTGTHGTLPRSLPA